MFSLLLLYQLVLKNRQNPVQHQRIVAFIGSPLNEHIPDVDFLKEANVALDVIHFGSEAEANRPALQAIIDDLNNSGVMTDPSHLLTIPLQANMVECLRQAQNIIGAGRGTMAGDEYFTGGADDDMDPELAMALKLSMEEEQARQQALNQKSDNTTGSNSGGKEVLMEEEESEEAMLAKAIAMSMEQQSKPSEDQK